MQCIDYLLFFLKEIVLGIIGDYRDCYHTFFQRFHCVKSVQIQGFSGLYFPVFSPNAGKHGPEKTSYLDTFHAVFVLSFL